MARTVSTSLSKDRAVEICSTSEDILELMPIDINSMSDLIHAMHVKIGWWHDIHSGESLERNRAELICLTHSELSECMEGERKDLMDDKLPHRRMPEVELADVLIRVCDYSVACGYDLGGAVREKLLFNLQRADHKPENRAKVGGKSF